MLAVVVVLGAAGGIVYRERSPQSTPAAAPPAPRHIRSAPTTSTTTTSPPPPFKLVSTSPGIAVYQLATGAQINIAATASCWTEMRTPDANAADVFAQTLTAGESHAITGPAWIRLGNPTAVTITVNGTRLQPPVTQGTPYDMEFQ